MPFDQDIFISYAHLDNLPLAEGLDGWVETLHKRLKILLAQLLGEEVSIWRDRKLQGNDIFADTLVESVSKAAVIVSVLSPRYVKSEWCLRELEEFGRAAAASGGLTVGDKSRVFKVVKTHVPLAEHPAVVRDLLGYEFFEYDAERGRAKEFSPEVAPQRDPRYWAALDDLAWDIKLTLERLRAASPQAAPAADAAEPALVSDPGSAKTVYLASSTSDVNDERDRLRRELQQRGHHVLPDRQLPPCAPEFQETVKEQLARSSLSVHLVGTSYGLIPEGEEELSVVHLQERLAAERGGADPAFTRLIWVPPGLEPKGARHARFVEELHTKLGPGAELLQTSVEDLKLRVLEKLAPRQKAAPEADPDGPKRVYLICDNRDQEEVRPIDDYLYDQGFEVIPSVFDGDSAQVAQFHRESLLSCDAALVYYGNANQMWLRSKLWDLQKAQGWGRPEPLRARAVYVSGPESAEKQRFRTREVPVVIQNFRQFSPDTLSPFLQTLRET